LPRCTLGHMAQPRLLLLVALTACTQVYPEPPKLDAGPDTGIPGVGVGGACTQGMDCRVGLVCKAMTHTCQPPGDKVPGSTCILSEECLPGNYCAMGMCKASGMAPEGGPCSTEGDCAAGLVCNLNGLSGTCAKPGLGDLGAACKQASECRAGLVCSNGSCQTMSTMPPPMTSQCTDDEPLPVAKVHFHVPRAGETSQDFFRLPFPNDIRVKNGRVDLTGFPRPGPGILGFDIVDRYIKAIEAEMSGFSLSPGVYFRFARQPDYEKLKMTPDAVTFTNLTHDSPQYGQIFHPGWYSAAGAERYICPRWMIVRHFYGAPLRPGETYAYLVKTSIVDDKGAPMQQDDDFKVMLADAPPADAALAAAWRAYAPLRAWIADKKIDAATIAAAAVFTTQKVDEPLVQLRAAVRAAPAPVVKSFVNCADAARSPCDDGKTGAEHERGCFGAGAAYDEYQGTVSVPVFQKGSAPYDQPSDGGGIEYDGGQARVQRTEDVCFALTVPKGTAPGAGWPVVVYSHGTGGSYRSFIEQQLARDFATGDATTAVPAMAMLGYDGALHATRHGASTRPVTELFYNFQNPLAARDNSLQAAADLFVIARALENFSAGGLKLDAKKLSLYGHSQGGNAAADAMPFEPDYGAVVLSGTGGTLILSLLNKTQPVNIASLIPFALGEAKVSADHPVLNLLQMYLDRADPVNFGRRLFSEPLAPAVPRHAFHVFGSNDSYAPVPTQRSYARSAGFDIVGPVIDPDDLDDIANMRRAAAISAPAKGNVTTSAGAPITAVEAQYKPGNYDGHFVSTQNASARRAIQQMLGTFVRDGVPTVNP
jgi:predicted esterase